LLLNDRKIETHVTAVAKYGFVSKLEVSAHPEATATRRLDKDFLNFFASQANYDVQSCH
jgi:hypothetical protein